MADSSSSAGSESPAVASGVPSAEAAADELEQLFSMAPGWLAGILRPGSGTSATMWVILNVLFAALFAMIALLLYLVSLCAYFLFLVVRPSRRSCV